MSVAAMQKELLNLPVSERVRLIDMLWESISEPQQQVHETAWAIESERRIDAFNEGKLTARSADEILRDFKKNLSR